MEKCNVLKVKTDGIGLNMEFREIPGKCGKKMLKMQDSMLHYSQ